MIDGKHHCSRCGREISFAMLQFSYNETREDCFCSSCLRVWRVEKFGEIKGGQMNEAESRYFSVKNALTRGDMTGQTESSDSATLDQGDEPKQAKPSDPMRQSLNKGGGY